MKQVMAELDSLPYFIGILLSFISVLLVDFQ